MLKTCQLIQHRIEQACFRSHRQIDSVRLVAVTKYAQWEWVEELLHLGCVGLGESRPQQLLQRAELAKESTPQVTPEWHLIGHLQRNKVKALLPEVFLIHSVDSMRLLEAIQKHAASVNLTPKVLLEVNVSGEAAKDGFSEESLKTNWNIIRDFSHLEIAGLMTMAPWCEDVEQTRPVFRKLRELRERLSGETDGKHSLTELSMGMSRDFEVAIEEGATMIRLGSILYQQLSDDTHL